MLGSEKLAIFLCISSNLQVYAGSMSTDRILWSVEGEILMNTADGPPAENSNFDMLKTVQCHNYNLYRQQLSLRISYSANERAAAEPVLSLMTTSYTPSNLSWCGCTADTYRAGTAAAEPAQTYSF